MDNAWHVVLRDIMVILAASSLVLVSVFAALVVWRLYRLGRVLHADLQPVIASLRQTADTVRDATSFTSGRAVSPAVGVIGAASGAFEVVRLLKQFYRGLRRDEGSGGA